MNDELSIDYFNNLLEAMAKGTQERMYRRTRLKPGDPIRPVDTNPEKAAIHGLQHDADNNPMKTGRGKASVRRQAKENQRHPERFAEAIEFIRENIDTPMYATIEKLPAVKDRQSLNLLVKQLLSQSNAPRRRWLESIVRA